MGCVAIPVVCTPDLMVRDQGREKCGDEQAWGHEQEDGVVWGVYDVC